MSPLRANPQNLPYFQLHHSVVAPPNGVEKNFNAVHNYKSFPAYWYQNLSIIQRLRNKVAFTIFVIQKREGQSTKSSNFYAAPAAREFPAPPNLAR